ncbi:hypothetical protein ALI144C_31895 [Actinosynnema sp. ALI-1.44]|nr:hypothetical protein ALI144C_31895 [Actinosynnema sp. ALI-1.44]
MRLKYGLNPQQAWAEATTADGSPLPFSVLNGTPSVINLLDALQGWQLVTAVSEALGLVAAASMKHVSPAGVAVAGELDDATLATFGSGSTTSEVAAAYIRARDCDPRSSYGDMVALSHPVDLPAARLLARVVSDGVIAPGYEPGVAEILARKKRGAFLVLAMDPGYRPGEREARDVFGVRITQDSDPLRISGETFPALSADAILGLLTVRHTTSNSVAYVQDGRTIGIGAGQQSRVDSVRLAGEKADRWRLRRHPRIAGAQFPAGMSLQQQVNARMALVEGQLAADLPIEPLSPGEAEKWLAAAPPCTLVSDGYLPFRDNVDVAAQHSVGCIVEGGGSRRSGEVDEACREHGIEVVRTGLRLFHH